MGSAVKKIIRESNKGLGSVVGDELGSALTTAGLVLGAMWTGGAALGAAGLTSAGAAAGGGLAGAAAGGSAAATSAIAGTAALGAGVSSYLGTKQSNEQMAAQEEAEARQRDIVKSQDLQRKKLLIAEQTGLQGRANAARNTRNNLQGLSRGGSLGGDNDKLGG